MIEVSGESCNRAQFLMIVSRQMQALSGCDALEFRICDGEIRYRWFTDFLRQPIFEDVQYIAPDGKTLVPVLSSPTDLESVCSDLFQPRYDPLLQFSYSRQHRYIEDTASALTLSDKRTTVTNLKEQTGYASMLLLSFMVEDNPPGLLILYSKETHFITPEDLPAYEDLMHTFSIALKFRRALYSLNERIKELSCLYEINQIYQEHADDPELLLKRVVEHIPNAFQYPSYASAGINIGDTEYTCGETSGSTHCLTADIVLSNEAIGRVQVYYPEHSEAMEPLHFLPEEQKLLDIIAQKVALVYEKIAHQKNRDTLAEQLRHADRLATVGQLASGIAHELNDPLANILGYAQLLLKTETAPETKSDLERIVRSSLHAREIVRKLLLFARQMPTQKSSLQLNKIILDTLDLLKSRLEQGSISLNVNLQPDLAELRADQSQMTQLVTNLVVNALQAMPSGGTISVITQQVDRQIRLIITDTGTGMDDETLKKIFMPFFTTKPVGIGTGLGLSVVHGIVDSHHGSITVKSTPGKGSTFTVVLPVKQNR